MSQVAAFVSRINTRKKLKLCQKIKTWSLDNTNLDR